ncbi:hypothetical protein [Rosettibacter firmus]|uniref:hypothetical protein n=1 Tax=Rosettibacter firmus TaxID=3111522 RepID=UPI00336C220F
MKKVNNHNRTNQIVGNMGLYYVCYELSKRGWNVLPTSRNAKGIDIVIYNQNAKRTHTIQVKTLSKKNPVPFGNNMDNLIAEYVIICRKVHDDKPEMFIISSSEVKEYIRTNSKNDKNSYWLQPTDYENYRDKWNAIGDGYE